LMLVVDELCVAIASTKLYELRLFSPRSVIPKQSIDVLIDALGQNPCLCTFSINGATEAQKERIRRLMQANGMHTARLAMGHAFAEQLGLPPDPGAGVARHLPGTDALQLARLNTDMHEARMQESLVDLVLRGDLQGITRLCERWASMEYGLKPSVLDEVLDVAQRSCRQKGDKAQQAETATKVLQAITHVKRDDGVPRYMPSQETLAKLAQLGSDAQDGALSALVESLRRT
jgi:hypothetical protein